MTFRTRKLQILSFGGNVDQFHLVPSKMLVEVRVCTRRKLAFYHSFPCQFVGRQDTQIYTHNAELCLSKEIVCTNYFLICSILLRIKFSQLIELYNHQKFILG